MINRQKKNSGTGSFMVNLKNKQTFYPNLVGAVSNRTGTECLINSKVYHIVNLNLLSLSTS